MDFFLEQCAVGPMANFAYLVGDPASGAGAIVDPGWEAARLLEGLQSKGLRLEAILLTHTHFDHIGALEELCQSGRPQAVYIHVDEALMLPELPVPVQRTVDGTEIMVGAVRIRCLHTPGHSPGGQCFLWDGVCLTGDTLFVDGCGRVDLPGSSPEQMFTSLRKLAALPPETTIYGGHDYGPTPASTMGEQLRTNSYLRASTQTAFYQQRGV